jgi:hypothetical protein
VLCWRVLRTLRTRNQYARGALNITKWDRNGSIGSSGGAKGHTTESFNYRHSHHRASADPGADTGDFLRRAVRRTKLRVVAAAPPGRGRLHFRLPVCCRCRCRCRCLCPTPRAVPSGRQHDQARCTNHCNPFPGGDAHPQTENEHHQTEGQRQNDGRSGIPVSLLSHHKLSLCVIPQVTSFDWRTKLFRIGGSFLARSVLLLCWWVPQQAA